jgi:hypothetical protein
MLGHPVEVRGPEEPRSITQEEMDDADWHPDQVEADIRLHTAFRQARKTFFDLLAEASSDKEPHTLTALRQEPVYDIAEMLYLWRAFDVRSREQVLRYIDGHNAKLAALLADKERMKVNGFTPGRIKTALFDEAGAIKLAINYTSFEGSFDQRDLARLLVQQMSPETCRKAVAKLSETGFVQRSTGVYNSILVRSHGKLENIFMRHLRAFRAGLTGARQGEQEKT